MKKITNFLASGLVVFSLFGGVVMATAVVGASTAHAAPAAKKVADPTPKEEVQDGVNAIGGDQAGRGPQAFTDLLQSIINILLFIIGAVAVIMIIIGGIKYTTSNGDQAQVTSAKNTILYAIVGLIVAIMSYAIVNFVIKNL